MMRCLLLTALLATAVTVVIPGPAAAQDRRSGANCCSPTVSRRSRAPRWRSCHLGGDRRA